MVVSSAASAERVHGRVGGPVALTGCCCCRLQVYHYSTQRVEEVTVTDPYSRGLSADGGRSMFVDLERDATLMPPGWRDHTSPAIAGVPLPSGLATHAGRACCGS